MIGKTKNKDKKDTKQTVEQERDLLKITLEYLIKENEGLKSQLEDMKMTVRTNKEQLREYVEKITNKDKVVEKMNNTIEMLQTRLQSMEEHFKNNSTGK